MRGKILSYDASAGTGLISGDDGQRYSFSKSDCPEGETLRPGKVVDFVPKGSAASDVLPVAGVLASKNKWVAAVVAFFFGYLGIHKFYLGRAGAGLAMLVVFLGGFILLGIPSIIIAVIAFVESIIYVLTGEDAFHERYVERKRAWF